MPNRDRPSSPPTNSGLAQWGAWLRKPSTLIIGGVIVVLGTGIYWAGQQVVYHRVSPWLETELSKSLQRPVKVGKVEQINFNQILLGPSSLPPTGNDASTINIQGIEININPLLFLVGKPIEIEARITSPRVVLKQNQKGEWLNLNLPKGEGKFEIPLDLNLKFKLEDAQVSLTPYATQKPILINLDGTGRYQNSRQKKQQEVGYDLNVKLQQSQLQAKGNTIIETGQTQTALKIQRLNLPELASLIPNFPVKIAQGQLNGDVKVNSPGFEKLENTKTLGNVNLANLQAKIDAFKTPLVANFNINLQGQTINVQQGEIALGKLRTNFRGGIDWRQGYNLTLQTNIIDIGDLLNTLAIAIPLPTTGKLKAQFQLTGKLQNPLLVGKIENLNPLTLDKIQIQSFQTNLRGTLDLLTLDKIRVQPKVGGNIQGQANLQLGILQSLKKKQTFNWEKMPVNLQLTGELPAQKLLQPYPLIPNDVELGDLILQGKISGLLGQPIIRVKWHDRGSSSIAQVSIRNQGEGLFIGSNFVLQNRLTNGKNGEIQINTKGNFRQDQWQASLRAREFLISPWVKFLCTKEFKSCPDQFEQEAWRIGQGTVNLTGSLAYLNPTTLQGQSQLLIQSQTDNINLQTVLNRGLLKTAIAVSSVNLNPYLKEVTVPVKLQQLQGNLTLPLSPLWYGKNIPLNQVQASGKVSLKIADQPFGANINLQRELLNLDANLSPFSLNAFLPQLPVKTELIAGQIKLATQVKEINKINWNTFSGNSYLKLKVANSPLLVKSNVRQGQLTAIAQVGKINLQKLLPQLTFSSQLNRGKVTLLARLDDVFKPQPNLQNVEAIADLKLAIAGGIVNSNSRLKQNQWQSYLQIQQIQPQQLLANSALNSLSPINGNLALTGNLNSLFNDSNSLPIKVNQAKLKSGDQLLVAKGNFLLDYIFKQPQISQLNLAINSNINLANLPINETVANLPITEALRPDSVNLTGIAQFQGQLTGKNITTLSQINLQGQTNVKNLALNREQFEPTLIGSLQLQGDRLLKINLKGTEDQLALDLKYCPQKSCLYPYLPDYFLVKHQYQTTLPIMAEGQRRGDDFQVKIAQFPLALLNLQPGKSYDLGGILAGDLQAQFSFNLSSQQGQGSLGVNQLSLGALQTDEVAANFDYQANILRLNDTYIKLGKSRYDLDASLNLKTLAVQSRLQISQGKVQDLLTALRISDVDSLTHLFKPNLEDHANDLLSFTLGNAQDPLQDQVNLLYKVDQDIRKWAAKHERGILSNELNIEGLFDADLHLTGSLTTPELAMQLKGNNWSWYPQPAIANIIPPLGLVMTNTRFLPIQNVNLQASFKEGILTVSPSEIIIKDSRLALEGNFSLEQNSAIWSVDNLSIDTIGTFVRLPSEITGILNAQGGITGTLTNPQVRGKFNFLDIAVNARPLNQAIAGNFSYNEAHLEVITERDSPLFFYTKIPFAVSEKDQVAQQAEKVDQFEMQIKAKKEALALIGALSQEQVSWVSGDGEINLKAQGELRFDKEISLADFEATGNISLNEAVLRSPTLPQPVTVSGDIILDNKILKIENLEGIFAKGKLSLTGNLPLFLSLGELDKPLTLRMNKTKIDLPNLYEGEAEGILIVKGTAFNPKITGGIRLANGQIFVPESPEISEKESSPLKVINWFKPRQNQPLLNPELNNFKISLDNLFVQQNPLYEFVFGGELMVNGSLANWNQLKPNGEILLSRGRVSFLDTRFLLDRRYRNAISFVPTQGILNPNLDIKMRTIVSELAQSKRLRSSESNEIPDDSLNRVQRIDINLAIDGPLTQLLPNLNQAQIDSCNREKQFRPLRGTEKLSEWRMKQTAMCLRILSAQGLYDEQVFRNPGIRLTSNPTRNQGQIVRLLGEQFIVLADAIQGKNSGQLLQYGLTQLAIPMIFQGTIYDIETAVSNSLGTTDFRVVPFFEAIYQVEDKAFVRFSYDYSFNEVKVLYEKQF